MKRSRLAVSGQRSALGVFVLAIALTLAALALPTPSVTRAQSGDPTLDAAQLAIWQATRRAQQTREAYDAQIAAQRATQAAVNAENARRAGEATRAVGETKSALEAYATLQAIAAQATRAAMQAEADQWRREATATQAAVNAETTRAAQTQTANARATVAAQTQDARQATATMQAIQVDATRIALDRAAEYEARFQTASLVTVLLIGAAVVVFAAVAIRALARQPRRVIVEENGEQGTGVSGQRAESSAVSGQCTEDRGAGQGASETVDGIALPPAPKTRVVFDPQAAERLKAILDFQETEQGNDDATRNTS